MVDACECNIVFLSVRGAHSREVSSPIKNALQKLYNAAVLEDLGVLNSCSSELLNLRRGTVLAVFKIEGLCW